MDPDTAVLAVFDESLPFEAVHEEAHPRPSRSDHLREQRLADPCWYRTVAMAVVGEPEQGAHQTLLGRMGQVIDDVFLVVHALPDQVSRKHFGEVRDTAQQADK